MSTFEDGKYKWLALMELCFTNNEDILNFGI